MRLASAFGWLTDRRAMCSVRAARLKPNTPSTQRLSMLMAEFSACAGGKCGAPCTVLQTVKLFQTSLAPRSAQSEHRDTPGTQ